MNLIVLILGGFRYEERFNSSWVHKELYEARNIRPSFHYGLWNAMALSAVDTFLFRGRAPWTLKHGKADHLATKKASECEKIEYIKPDGVVRENAKRNSGILNCLFAVAKRFRLIC